MASPRPASGDRWKNRKTGRIANVRAVRLMDEATVTSRGGVLVRTWFVEFMYLKLAPGRGNVRVTVMPLDDFVSSFDLKEKWRIPR